MNATRTVIMAMIVAFAMIGTLGMTSAATTYDSSVVLDNKDASNAYALTPGDGSGAVIEYNFAADLFEWSASGTVPLTGEEEYSLIYYADRPDRFNPTQWGGDNPGALIGTITTDANGDIILPASGSTELNMDLPHANDYNIAPDPDYCDYHNGYDDFDHCSGAKLWMVPSSNYSNNKVVSWLPDTFLLETDLITYVDCDLYETSPPATATFSIEDALVGEPMDITITNATNVGAVEVVLTYDASALMLSNVVNGDMDSTWSNDVSGQVTIGTNQGDNMGLNGDFILAGLNFTPINNGAYDFSYVVVTYKDATPCGRTMPYDFGDDIGVMYLNGDVNNDGDVDMFDVMYLAKNVIGISGFENIIELASDVDGDGDIDMEDVTYLAMHIVGASSWEVLL